MISRIFDYQIIMSSDFKFLKNQKFFIRKVNSVSTCSTRNISCDEMDKIQIQIQYKSYLPTIQEELENKNRKRKSQDDFFNPTLKISKVDSTKTGFKRKMKNILELIPAKRSKGNIIEKLNSYLAFVNVFWRNFPQKRKVFIWKLAPGIFFVRHFEVGNIEFSTWWIIINFFLFSS